MSNSRRKLADKARALLQDDIDDIRNENLANPAMHKGGRGSNGGGYDDDVDDYYDDDDEYYDEDYEYYDEGDADADADLDGNNNSVGGATTAPAASSSGKQQQQLPAFNGAMVTDDPALAAADFMFDDDDDGEFAPQLGSHSDEAGADVAAGAHDITDAATDAARAAASSGSTAVTAGAAAGAAGAAGSGAIRRAAAPASAPAAPVALDLTTITVPSPATAAAATPTTATGTGTVTVTYRRARFADRLGALADDVLTRICDYLGNSQAHFTLYVLSRACARFVSTKAMNFAVPLHKLPPRVVLHGLRRLRTVPTLNLANCTRLAILPQIAAAVDCRAVRSLSLANHKLLTPVLLGDLVERMTALAHIDLSGSNATDSCLDPLLAAAAASLRSADVSDTKLTTSGLLRLLRACPVLERLVARGLPVSLELCAGLARHAALRSVDLSRCRSPHGVLIVFPPAAPLAEFVCSSPALPALTLSCAGVRTVRVDRAPAGFALTLAVPAAETLSLERGRSDTEVTVMPYFSEPTALLKRDAAATVVLDCTDLARPSTWNAAPGSRYHELLLNEYANNVRKIEHRATRAPAHPLLPRLKTLSLAGCKYAPNTLSQLFAHAPALKTLNLEAYKETERRLWLSMMAGNALQNLTALTINPYAVIPAAERDRLIDVMSAAVFEDEQRAARDAQYNNSNSNDNDDDDDVWGPNRNHDSDPFGLGAIDSSFAKSSSGGGGGDEADARSSFDVRSFALSDSASAYSYASANAIRALATGAVTAGVSGLDFTAARAAVAAFNRDNARPLDWDTCSVASVRSALSAAASLANSSMANDANANKGGAKSAASRTRSVAGSIAGSSGGFSLVSNISTQSVSSLGFGCVASSSMQFVSRQPAALVAPAAGTRAARAAAAAKRARLASNSNSNSNKSNSSSGSLRDSWVDFNLTDDLEDDADLALTLTPSGAARVMSSEAPSETLSRELSRALTGDTEDTDADAAVTVAVARETAVATGSKVRAAPTAGAAAAAPAPAAAQATATATASPVPEDDDEDGQGTDFEFDAISLTSNGGFQKKSTAAATVATRDAPAPRAESAECDSGAVEADGAKAEVVKTGADGGVAGVFAPRTWMDAPLWNAGAAKLAVFEPLKDWDPIEDNEDDNSVGDEFELLE